MSEQIVLRCEDSLEGIFTALFDAFVCKNKMKAPYTDSISIAAGEVPIFLASDVIDNLSTSCLCSSKYAAIFFCVFENEE